MVAHPLVAQLRFARTEFVRGLDGVPEGLVWQLPMNSLGWMVGHMANQLVPGLRERVGTARPASTPSLAGMWSVWRTVTPAADEYLDTLTVDDLGTYLKQKASRSTRASAPCSCG